MKYPIIIVAVLLTLNSVLSQKDTFIVILEYQWDKSKTHDFYVKELIDSRNKKDIIGYHRRGKNDLIPMILKDGTLKEFERVFNKMVPISQDKRALGVHVNRLWVGDNGRISTVELSLEFFEIINGVSTSIGISHQFISGRSGQHNKRHQRNIRKGIAGAIKEFANSAQRPIIDTGLLLNFEYGLDSNLNIGAYRTYNALIRNQNRSLSNSIKIKSKRKKLIYSTTLLRKAKRD